MAVVVSFCLKLVANLAKCVGRVESPDMACKRVLAQLIAFEVVRPKGEESYAVFSQ